MALTTYSELKTSIANFLNRDDLTSAIPDFITLAEAQIQRDLQHWQMEDNQATTVSSRYTVLPDGFYQPVRLHVDGANKALQTMSTVEMQDMRYANDDTAGEPLYYAITGGKLEVFPTPDDSYSVNIVFIKELEKLSDANTSNWLLDEAPDVYLYGSLMQSAPYLMNDQRLAVWQTLYASGINGLQTASDNARWGSNLRLR